MKHEITQHGKRSRMDRRQFVFALLCLGFCVACLLGEGCFVDEKPYPDNSPPVTYLSIQAESLRTINYRTIISWWGTDRDGHITGYAYKWGQPWQPATGDSLWWEDSSWTFTEATRDTFDVPIAGTFAERTFTVRAIDNDLLADPDPPDQTFRLENFKPLVSWTDTTRHPTLLLPSLPAVSFAWTPEDYDGRQTVTKARLWLDTIDGENPDDCTITVVGDTVGAFFPDHFQGRYGERTVYMQVTDDALTVSDTISWTWNVVPPQGEYLVIDTAWPSNSSAADKQDDFWYGQFDSLLAGNYHIYDMETQGVFRSAQEVLPIFKLFKGVLWYGIKYYSNSGGSSALVDEAMRFSLSLAENAIMTYVSEGGHLFITGHNLIGTGGGLSRDFWQNQLGIVELYEHYDPDAEADVTNSILPRLIHVQCADGLFGETDSLKVRINLPEAEFFHPSSAMTPLLWVDLTTSTVEIRDLPDVARDQVYVGAMREIGDGRFGLGTAMLTEFYSNAENDPAGAFEAFLRDFYRLP
jgi:hypothetical protein